MTENYSKLEEVPLSSIKPKGIMYDFLCRQATGLTGNIEAAGYPYNTYRWDNYKTDKHAKERGKSSWWPYEQTGYWYDGAEKCAVLTDNKELLDKVQKAIDYVIENKAEDGFLGPGFMRELEGYGQWAQVVFFRMLMAKFSETGDKRIISLLCDHYKASDVIYSRERAVLNVEILLWLYLNTGDKSFLDISEKSYAEYDKNYDDKLNEDVLLNSEPIHVHGVTFNEYLKLGAILYICTGKEKYLKPVLHGCKKADRYMLLADGLHSSEEETWNRSVLRAHETCNISDYTWTLGYILMATGDGKWADKTEKCIYNAGIGAVEENFRGLQYFSSPNQLVFNRYSNRCRYNKGNEWMSYAPNPGTECCAGNVNRFFPNFCSRMWMQKNNALYAIFYGSSELRFKELTVEEQTEYPFDEKVIFKFRCKKSTKLDFYLRIPAWCTNPEIKINGKKCDVKIKNGFALADREFSDGDTICLTVPSEIKVKKYNRNGIYIEKGPLVYAFGMYGKRSVAQSPRNFPEDFPALDMYPDKAWNYAICMGEDDISDIRFMKSELNGNPWDIRFTPCKITLNARKVNNWDFEHHTRIKRYLKGPFAKNSTRMVTGNFVFTPDIPSKKFILENGVGKKEKIELVPMGAAKIRLTVFPFCD